MYLTFLGEADTVNKLNKRTVRVTKKHNDDCKELLSLLGVPYLNAPSEAEAQCAALAKYGTVFAAASEDMDTLTFGSPILLRHMTFSEARKMPIREVTLQDVLNGLEMSYDEFIDLCILLGCDYCDGIRGVGPKTAVTLIKQYKSIEAIVEACEEGKLKYTISEDWVYREARELFRKPDVLPEDSSEVREISWKEPNLEGLIEFLCKRFSFEYDYSLPCLLMMCVVKIE